MNRRNLLLSTAALAVAGTAPLTARAAGGEAALAAGWRRFELTTRIALNDTSAPATLWVPLAQTLGDYQQAAAPRWSTDAPDAAIVTDDRYGAPMLRLTWLQPGPHTVELAQAIATRDRTADPLAALDRAERAFWLEPVESLPTDGIVRATADRITANAADPHAKLLAIYDWVVDNTFRDPATRGCGVGDVKALLESGRFGGKCADINGLLVALARASGIPARETFGIRVAASRFYPCLGIDGNATKAQHCRAEAFIDGAGWLPLDPADVRKVVLEAKLPIDDAGVVATRARLFGESEGNWVGFNHATDIALPGAPRPMNANFLMYPCAMSPAGEADCLDPGNFRYEIASREWVS